MLVIFWFNRRLDILVISYSVMLAHELAHMAAALCIGLRPAFFAFHPFGICMRLKSRIVYSLSDEIILYAAGPLLNIILALCARAFFHGAYAHYFYMCNISLFALNLLPVMPLDGGVIARRTLMFFFGAAAAGRIMKILSFTIITALFALGIYAVYITGYNYSVIVLASMLLGNVFTQKEKFNTDFLKELMFYTKKDAAICGKKLRVIAARDTDAYRSVAEHFRSGGRYIVCFTDKNGHITAVKTEREIMDALFDRCKTI